MTDIADIDREWKLTGTWRDAITELERGNAAPVASLVRAGDMPADVRAEFAAALDAAKITPPVNADKSKLSTTQRRELRSHWQAMKRILDVALELSQEDTTKEPWQNRKLLAEIRANITRMLEREYGVSNETIRKNK